MKIAKIEAFALRYPNGETSQNNRKTIITCQLRGGVASTHATTKQWSCVSPHRMALSAMVKGKVRSHRVHRKQSVEDLCRPILTGQDPFDVEYLWQRMFTAMRERGHYTGFLY